MFFTEKQLRILNFIRDFRDQHGISPTLEELARHFGVSKITVYEHVCALEKKGALRRARNMARSIELTSSQAGPGAGAFPLLGTIAAGKPIEAVEDRQDVHLTDFVPDRGDCYFLKVTGSSLIEDHITEGDYVLVDRSAQPRNGDVVVAVVDDGEATLKHFFREGGRVRLQPANREMSPIYPSRLDVRGVVRAVFRRL
ncbi:MAG: transcriptional repressor LexA [Planctomycetota bacterium]